MEFRLIYRGPLASNGDREEKQAIRRAIHVQMARLWSQPPLEESKLLVLAARGTAGTDLRDVGPFCFLPLVTRSRALVAELDITFLRPGTPGQIVGHGGDIDNRIKTLLDALRVPTTAGELPAGDRPQDGEEIFFCLLEDDALVTRLAVTADQLLEPAAPEEVLLVINVRPRATQAQWNNVGLG